MQTISFAGECQARSKLVLVSKRINHAYVLKRIVASFEQGASQEMKLRFYKSLDDDAPTTREPSGTSILRDYGQVDYVIGEASQKQMEQELEVAEKGSYLKVFADNNDFFSHLIDVQMYIEQK
jgi:hypothetical protein